MVKIHVFNVVILVAIVIKIVKIVQVVRLYKIDIWSGIYVNVLNIISKINQNLYVDNVHRNVIIV